MINRYWIKGRYGQSFTIDHDTDTDEWYLDLDGASFVRYGNDPESPNTLEFIDPDGGPFIQIGTSLKLYQNQLPDNLIITSITYDINKGKYKLGVTEKI